MTKIPTFFNPANAGSWAYEPTVRSYSDPSLLPLATEYRNAYGIRASATDQYKIELLLIDLQRDFCNKEGSLFVGGRSGTGAIDDNVRICQFIYKNMDVITGITPTLDTHKGHQIFFPSFWLKQDGSNVDPYTLILAADVASRKYQPDPAVAKKLNVPYPWLVKFCTHYCSELEKAGKYVLYIWPEHCLLGTIGHTLAGVVQEAVLFHTYARFAQGEYEIKGGNALTENYSMLSPEVLTRHDGVVLAQKNARFIKRLLKNDAIVIGGQAASHCVKSSIDDLLTEILAMDASLVKKVYVLRDCMSAVVVPGGPDYTDDANAALDRFANAGMNVVNSVDDIRGWPGIRL